MKKNDNNNIVVRDVTPQMTEEERKEKASYIVEGLLKLFSKKDKTA